MLGAIWNVVRGAGALVGIGTAAAVGDQIVTGGSFTERLVGGIGKSLGFGQNEAGTESSYNWFGKLIEMFSRFLKDTIGESPLTQGMDRLSARMQDKDVETISDYTGGPDAHPAAQNNANGVGISNADGIGGWALGAGAVAGVGAAAVGARAIPIVGGVVAAADTVMDVGGFVLKGEWQKAGVRTFSGIADTVGSSFGLLGFAFGQAAREGIENTGEAVLGEEAHLEDSATTALAKRAYDFTFGGRG